MKQTNRVPRFGPPLLASFLGALLVIGGLLLPALALAATYTIRVTPASITGVAVGGSFTVRIVQNADAPTSGAQITMAFDQAKLQITSLAKGSPYASALWAGDSPAAITSANGSGKLATVGATLLPPSTVPAGDADFLSITFKAVACGKSDLGLPVGPFDSVLLDGRTDTYGDGLVVTTTGGSVDIPCAGGSPSPSASPGASPSGSPTPSSSPDTQPTSEPPAAEPPAAEPPPASGGGGNGTTGTPPETAALPFQTAPGSDWWPLIVICLSMIVSGVAVIDGARQLARRRQ